MKKFLSFLTATALVMSTSAYAANNPPYLYICNGEKVPEDADPPHDLEYGIPYGADMFTYSFGKQDIQYSDYELAFTTADSDIIIYYRALSGNHTLTLNIERLGSPKYKHVFNKEIEVVTDEWNKLRIDRELIKEAFPSYHGGFYISLTDAKSVPESIPPEYIPSGMMIVTGSVEFGKEAVISRGDFAIELAELIDNDIIISKTEPFSDVNIYNHPYEAVMKLKVLGIINGFGYNTYSPKANITYEQALNMAARLFASNEEIEAMGGYPQGGIVVCEKLGLSYGLTDKESDKLTVVNQFILMSNMKTNINKMRKF